MSLYSWNVIATVAEHHSISQAANILNLTPSAVSHMVKKVEDGVGYALFIRERNHFELTSSGKALLPYIQNYLKCRSQTISLYTLQYIHLKEKLLIAVIQKT